MSSTFYVYPFRVTMIAVKQETLKYYKKSQHMIFLAYKLNRYDNGIRTCHKEDRKAVATFIKEAIQEKDCPR